MNKIQPLKGFRDFLPTEAKKRLWLKNKLAEIFELWGYEPMETPTLEPLELFEGQIGEDEKLFYKFKDNGGRDVALRYDQTVPTCRIVGQNYQELPIPFKRYQIQSAFRAENTQRGRYRELLQADADIFGISSPLADAEVIALSLDIYRRLGFKKAVVLVNDRSLLRDLPYAAISAIDKLDKIGTDGVINDMVAKGIPETKAKEYLNYINTLKPNETIQTIFDYLENFGFPSDWYKFEPTLARSFSYSSGPIWEVKIPDFSAGSVLGGERYDNLVEQVSGVKIPGTGFGLGFDRTLLALEELNLINIDDTKPSVLVSVFSEESFNNSLKITNELRQKNVKVEIYPDSKVKLDKQLKYANKKGVNYVLILGPDEISSDTITIKNLATKTQENISQDNILEYIK